MQRFTADTANTITFDLVTTEGVSIVGGTVTAYLVADSGTNAAKWFRTSDDTWQAAEASAGTATYKGGSSWQIAIDAAAWDTGVKYTAYCIESGNLNIEYSDSITEMGSIETTIEIEETSVS